MINRYHKEEVDYTSKIKKLGKEIISVDEMDED